MNDWISKPPPGSILDPGFEPNKYCVLCMLFNEGSGILANDIAGGNDGTLMNMPSPPTPTSGWHPEGLSFDGVNDYVNLGVGGLSEIHQTPITITAWIKAPIQTASYAGILSNDYLGPRTGFTLSLRSIGYLAFWSAGDTWDTGGNYVTDNKWHFVVATLDISGNLYFYVDNNKYGPYSNALFNSSAAGTYIGRRFDGSYFNGLIDNVSIYNKALSAEEIAYLYQHKWADIWKPSLTSYFYPTGWKFYRSSMLGGLRV